MDAHRRCACGVQLQANGARWGGKTSSTAIAARDLAKAREKGLSQTRPTGDTAYALRASRDAKIKAAESGEICGEPAVRQPL